uniref:BY PROTMAP: gi/342319927/gb/EGU11872.1/ LigA [Rhodotorula glutinis ATCC 204091] n=1 Tax=Rhodotorula toruloides TaxID=5286 RepID=A0A0K3CDF2_RHOTO
MDGMGRSEGGLERSIEAVATPEGAHQPPSEPTTAAHHPTPTSTPIAPPRDTDTPAASEPQQPHPLASFLLAEYSLSPPASPTTSVSSFPGSRTRLSSAAGEVGTRSRSGRAGRGRGHGRTGSVSSTVSTYGSAHEEGGSSEDDHHAGAAGLVMPSLHLGRPALSNSSRGATEDRPARRAKVLVLGRTADERRTLARLGPNDDDLQRVTSGASVGGATDMSFSFLSTKTPSQPEARPRSPPADSDGPFERISSSQDSSVGLYHPADSLEGDELLDVLACPLEQLEAKLNREYPSTTGICQLVEAVGCGDLEACMYLFSAPPTACEIALARPISHLIPLIPVLILPPSPNGKPQRTTALSQAVQEQLDGAGVRWVPARPSPRGRASVGGALYMLPSDLFARHDSQHFGHDAPGSSPTSEGGPPSTSSLSSSQELLPPSQLSSAPPSTVGEASGARSLAASAPSSTRSSESLSSRSSSHQFSKRVAVRRQALSRPVTGATSAVEGASSATDDDGDVLGASEDEDAHDPPLAEHHDSLGTSFTNDPLTPRCATRDLTVPLASIATIVLGAETSPTGSATDEGYFPRYPSPSPARSYAPPHLDDVLESSTSSLQSSTASGASILVLPSSDPFHLPSLLHLVGLNLRLSVFAPALSPATSSASASSVESASEDDASSKREERRDKCPASRGGWGWLRTTAVLSLVFAAGIAVGTQIVAVVDGGGGVGGSGWDLTASVKAEHLRPELEALFFKYYEVKPPYYVPPPPFSFDPSLGPPEVVREPTIEESQERETYRGWLDVERRARFIKMMEEGEELAQQHGMRVREKEMRELERLLGNPQEAEHWAKLSAELEV